jgi:hypothetical protein
MEWTKKGLIFKVDNNSDWMCTHSSLPTIDKIDDAIRIYFNTRCKNGISRITYLDVDSNNPKNIIYVHNKPVLELGRLGTFDDNGMMACSIVNNGGKKYMYYIGWNLCGTVSYSTSIGLAIYNETEKRFIKYSEAPIFSRSIDEPFFVTSLSVIVENSIWKMWYTSCTGWANKSDPYYNIKYAESKDGINWKKISTAIDCIGTKEVIGCPRVFKDNGIYKMLYSYREVNDFRGNKEKSYRIGYAESMGGLLWSRIDDNAGINVSEDGWDSEMIEYAFYVKHNNKEYLFYNGNGFGKSGLGYAELKQ